MRIWSADGSSRTAGSDEKRIGRFFFSSGHHKDEQKLCIIYHFFSPLQGISLYEAQNIFRTFATDLFTITAAPSFERRAEIFRWRLSKYCFCGPHVTLPARHPQVLSEYYPVLTNIVPPPPYLRRKEKRIKTIKNAEDRKSSLLAEILEDTPTHWD